MLTTSAKEKWIRSATRKWVLLQPKDGVAILVVLMDEIDKYEPST